MIDATILTAVLALAVMLLRDGLRHTRQTRLNASLEAALAPQPLEAKYLCVMSADEVKALHEGRWD